MQRQAYAISGSKENPGRVRDFTYCSSLCVADARYSWQSKRKKVRNRKSEVTGGLCRHQYKVLRDAADRCHDRMFL
jgi:hypothetical protein